MLETNMFNLVCFLDFSAIAIVADVEETNPETILVKINPFFFPINLDTIYPTTSNPVIKTTTNHSLKGFKISKCITFCNLNPYACKTCTNDGISLK